MLQNRYQNYFLIAVFIGIISFPFINSKITIVKDIKSSENRKMADFPKPDINYLDGYPSAFDKYYSDNFSLRSILIKYYNDFTLGFFKKSPIPDKLVIGKDDWLFLGGNELESYRGKNGFSKEDLETFKKELEYRKQYLASRNCKFYVLVAPIKAAIYSEKMPSNVFRIYEKSWGEQLVNYMEQNSDVNMINLYDAFKSDKSKTKNPLYYRLDNHWNSVGGYYGASAFLSKVHKDFPMINPTPISEYNVTKQAYNTGNIAEMLSESESYVDTVYSVDPKKGYTASKDKPIGYPCIEGFPYCNEFEIRYSIKNSSDTSKPKLLIISDSFGANFIPFAAEQFGETVKIFDSWQYKLNEPFVRNEKPDVVLLIMLESNMKNLLRYTSCPDIKKPKE